MTYTTKRLLNKLENTDDEIIKYPTLLIGIAVFLAINCIFVVYDTLCTGGIRKHKGDNTQMLFKAMGKYADAKLIRTLGDHDILCVETFCALTEADFTEMKLTIGQRTNCILAAKQIRDNRLHLLSEVNEAENKELLLPSQNEET